MLFNKTGYNLAGAAFFVSVLVSSASAYYLQYPTGNNDNAVLRRWVTPERRNEVYRHYNFENTELSYGTHLYRREKGSKAAAKAIKAQAYANSAPGQHANLPTTPKALMDELKAHHGGMESYHMQKSAYHSKEGNKELVKYHDEEAEKHRGFKIHPFGTHTQEYHKTSAESLRESAEYTSSLPKVSKSAKDKATVNKQKADYHQHLYEQINAHKNARVGSISP